MEPVTPRWLVLCVALCCIACDPTPSAPPKPKQFALQGGPSEVAGRMASLEKAYAKNKTLHHSFDGELKEGAFQDVPVMLVGTECYLFLATADSSVADLDLLLIDDKNNPLEQDDEEGPDAPIGLRHSVCPRTPSMHTLRIKAFKGSGKVAIRVFSAQAL